MPQSAQSVTATPFLSAEFVQWFECIVSIGNCPCLAQKSRERVWKKTTGGGWWIKSCYLHSSKYWKYHAIRGESEYAEVYPKLGKWYPFPLFSSFPVLSHRHRLSTWKKIRILASWRRMTRMTYGKSNHTSELLTKMVGNKKSAWTLGNKHNCCVSAREYARCEAKSIEAQRE